MAHIPDGVLSAEVLVAGGLLAGSLVAVSLRRLPPERIPVAAVLAAVFFVASLIQVPVGVTSVHPLLVGLIGLVLGWAAVPAILVALLLQAVFFGFGGLLVLGVNAANIAVPALLVAALARPLLCRASSPRQVFVIGVAAGGLGVALTASLVCLALSASASAYVPALAVVAASYGPLAVVEAGITGAAAALLWRVKPEVLGLAADGVAGSPPAGRMMVLRGEEAAAGRTAHD